MARQFRVDDLIGVGAKLARLRDLNQEVSPTAPPAVEERALIDHIGAIAHRLDRLCLRSLQLVYRESALLDDDDVERRFRVALQVVPLMLLAECAEKIERRILSIGTLDLAKRGHALELCQVLAFQMTNQIRCAQDQDAVGVVHR